MLRVIVVVCLMGITIPTQELQSGDLQHTYPEVIGKTDYPLFTNQTLSLRYDSYPGVFTMDLKKVVTNGTTQTLLNEDYELFQEDAGQNLEESGCVAFQREITTNNNLALSLPSTEVEFFTDIVVIPAYNKSFAVRGDYELYEIQMFDDGTDAIQSISYQGNHASFFPHLDKKAFKTNLYTNQPFLIADPESKRVFIITQYGGVSFDPSKSLASSDKFIFRKEPFHLRNNVYDIHYNDQHHAFFVAVGLAGVDVYSLADGHLKYFKTFNATTMGEAHVNIVDIDTSDDGTKLYIQNAQKGFTYLDITDINNPKVSSFLIPIPKAIAFDHYKNTFIFIENQVNRQDQAVEVFVDFDLNTYYYNRFYVDEMQLFDIVMFDFYAVLVGYDAHKLIFHSVYHGFIDDNLEHHTIFTEPDLVKVMEYEWDEKNSRHQIVGLAKYEFKTFHVEYVHPTVKCHAKEAYKGSFLLQMNATNCRSKEIRDDNSQFSQCNITHAFNLDVQEVFISTRSKIWVYIAIIFSLVVIVSLAWALYLCWQKWSRSILMLDTQILDLKKQEKYGNLQEVEQANIQPNQEDA